MPTRYTLELEGLKGVVSNDTFKETGLREDAKKTGMHFGISKRLVGKGPAAETAQKTTLLCRRTSEDFFLN